MVRPEFVERQSHGDPDDRLSALANERVLK